MTTSIDWFFEMFPCLSAALLVIGAAALFLVGRWSVSRRITPDTIGNTLIGMLLATFLILCAVTADEVPGSRLETRVLTVSESSVQSGYRRPTRTAISFEEVPLRTLLTGERHFERGQRVPAELLWDRWGKVIDVRLLND